MRRYAPLVRSRLRARWSRSKSGLLADLDDTVQDVFMELFRRGGALERMDHNRPGGLEAFLFGVTRNVALRAEGRRRRDRKHYVPANGRNLDNLECDERRLPRLLDCTWVARILRQALARQSKHASRAGSAAERRVELLRLRFFSDLTIREIASRWNEPRARVHKEYARARREFHSALLEVMTCERPGTLAEVEAACEGLVGLVS